MPSVGVDDRRPARPDRAGGVGDADHGRHAHRPGEDHRVGRRPPWAMTSPLRCSRCSPRNWPGVSCSATTTDGPDSDTADDGAACPEQHLQQLPGHVLDVGGPLAEVRAGRRLELGRVSGRRRPARPGRPFGRRRPRPRPARPGRRRRQGRVGRQDLGLLPVRGRRPPWPQGAPRTAATASANGRRSASAGPALAVASRPAGTVTRRRPRPSPTPTPGLTGVPRRNRSSPAAASDRGSGTPPACGGRAGAAAARRTRAARPGRTPPATSSGRPLVRARRRQPAGVALPHVEADHRQDALGVGRRAGPAVDQRARRQRTGRPPRAGGWPAGRAARAGSGNVNGELQRHRAHNPLRRPGVTGSRPTPARRAPGSPFQTIFSKMPLGFLIACATGTWMILRPSNRSLLLDVDVDGEDDVVGRLDVGGRQLVLDPHGPLRLDLDRVPELLADLLQRLGGHVRVGDAGRAGGDGDDFHGVLLRGQAAAVRGRLDGVRRLPRPSVTCLDGVDVDGRRDDADGDGDDVHPRGVDDEDHDRPAVGGVVADPAEHGDADPTAEPNMMHGMTRSGSAAANGMAPSVMPTQPMANAATPASRSASVHRSSADQRRQAQAHRRDADGRGHRPHHLVVALGDQARAEEERRLVDRPAHVERDHAPEDQPQHEPVARAHRCQPRGQAVHAVGDRQPDHEQHDEADHVRPTRSG